MELKQNIGTRVPVRLRAVVDGSPLTGATYLQVTVYLQKQSGSSAAKVLGPSDWFEIDATNMPGEYDLVLQNADLDTLGFFKYTVNYPGISIPYSGLIQVVANIASDVYTDTREILGLLHKNAVVMNQTYNVSGRLTGATLKIYDTAAHAILNDGVTGLLKTYNIVSTYDVQNHETLYRLAEGP